MLFDEDFVNNIPAPENWEGRPLVNIKANHFWLLGLLSNWYRELIPNGDPNLYSRLRNVNSPVEFLSAFWELVILRFLREEGHNVQSNALLNGKTPDLFWPQCDIIGDVVAISDPNFSNSSRVHLDQFLQMVDRENLPFEVAITHFDFKEGRNPQLRSIVDWVKRLEKANRIDLYTKAQEYKDEYCNLEVMIKKRNGRRGGVGSVDMFSLDSEQLKKIIKDRVRKKVKKYRRPLVVFIGAGLGHWPVNEDNLHMALYGDWQVHFSREPGQKASDPDTACNGVFFNRKGSNGGPANRELSVVILARWHIQGKKLLVHFRAYHNPEAIHPLPKEFFFPMAQFIVTSEELKQCTLEWINENNSFILGDPLPSTPTR